MKALAIVAQVVGALLLCLGVISLLIWTMTVIGPLAFDGQIPGLMEVLALVLIAAEFTAAYFLTNWGRRGKEAA